jgi:phospholipase C
MNPIEIIPTTSFAEVMRVERRALATNKNDEEPIVANAISFTVSLFNKGAQIGWLGVNSLGWAILVTDPTKALVLEQYPDNGVTYYRIKGTARYMSVSTGAYVGFYNWLGATGFKMQGTNMVSDYNGQKLSFYSTANQYLYAWDAYTVLDVKLESTHKPVIPNQPLTDLIEHVVVVMLENRSFDNMLGGLYPKKTMAGLYRGLKGNETNPLDPNNPGKGSVQVFQGEIDQATWIMPYPDPGELFTDMNEQIFGTANPGKSATSMMTGFAWNYGKQPGAPLTKGGPDVMPDPKNIMQYYHQDAVPMTTFLAKQFAVCDWWFASGPVQTFANRIFAHCGTPGLKPGTNHARINNPDFTAGWSHTPPFEPPVQEKTIFELLDDSYPGELNWKVYYHDAPASALCRYVYDHWSWDTLDGGNVFNFQEHFSSKTNLEYDIKNNRLPKYSFIEPRFTDTFGGTVNSSHPGGAGVDWECPNGDSLPPPISVKDGERFLAQVYGILERYPETFKKTLLIVIFDEHGGLYDHQAPPPGAVSPFTHPVDNFSYDRYGVRIPAMLVNPNISPGTIYPPRGENAAFDHTSLISTICGQFGLKGTLTPRSAVAPMLKNLIPNPIQSYQRPAPPVIPVADPSAVKTDSNLGPMIDMAEVVRVSEQRSPSFSNQLMPLLAIEQRRKAKLLEIKAQQVE